MIFKKANSPSENFELLTRFIRLPAFICGLDLLNPNYKMTWNTYSLFTLVASYFVFVFLTIATTYKDDWTIILRATVTLGSGFQGVSKIFSFVTKQKLIVELFELLNGIYRNYEQMGDKYTKALKHSMEKAEQGLVLFTIFYIVGIMGMISLPFISYAFTGSRFLVIEFLVPGLDVNTEFGYLVTLIFQSILVVCTAFGLYAGDLVSFVYLIQGYMFSNIFRAKIDYVNEMVVDPKNNAKPNVTKALKEIAEWHQIYLDYTMKCNDLLYVIITVQIMTAFVSTLLSVYLIVAGGWPGAYSYVLIAFCCLYLYCVLGTLTEIANDKITEDIYDVHWYNLTVVQQKIVLQILCKSQSPQTIDIAGVMPLTVSTALQLTKTIFSFTMFMIEFFLE
ncbi:odorant receptor 67d-like isoform 1-T1 [Cochliomyia hominivorax]